MSIISLITNFYKNLMTTLVTKCKLTPFVVSKGINPLVEVSKCQAPNYVSRAWFGQAMFRPNTLRLLCA